MSFLKLLAYLNVFIFFAIMLFGKLENKNTVFVKFILLSLPFLALSITPLTDGFCTITLLHALLFFKNKKTKVKDGIFYSIVVALLLLFIIIGLFVCDLSPDEESMQRVIQCFCVFIFTKILIQEIVNDEAYFYKVINFLKISLIVSFVFLFIQMVVGVKFSLTSHIRPNVIIGNAIRYPSFFADPQHYSQYLSVMSFVCLFVNPHLSAKKRYIDFILIFFCLVSILSSGGRSGLMGFLLCFGLIFLFIKAKYKISLSIIAISAYALVLNFQNSFSMFKRGSDLNDTYEFRYMIWTEAYQMFLNNPYFGLGIGNYARHVFLHNPNQFWLDNNELQPFDVPENGYLKLLTEIGGLGFLMFGILMIYPFIINFFLFLKTKDFNLLFFCCCIITWMVSFSGTYTFGDPRILIVMITIVCLMITYRNLVLSRNQIIEDEDILIN